MRFRDLVHMAHIRATASSQDKNIWETLPNAGQLVCQLLRVAVIKVFCFIEFGVAAS